MNSIFVYQKTTFINLGSVLRGWVSLKAYPGLILMCLFHLPTEARVINQVVGMVQDRVVTAREVQINTMIEMALYPENITSGAGVVMKDLNDFESKEFSKQVTSVLMELVISMEAELVTIARPTKTELQEANKSVSKRWEKKMEWTQLKPSSREVSQMISRKLLAKKFIRFRADTSVTAVSEVELDRYLELNKKRFEGLTLEESRSQIRKILDRQQVERRLKDWFDVLKAKYQVRQTLAEV